MRANVLTTDSPAAARHPLLEGEEEDRTYRTDMTNRMMKAIRILMMVVGMMVVGCTPPSPLSRGGKDK